MQILSSAASGIFPHQDSPRRREAEPVGHSQAGVARGQRQGGAGQLGDKHEELFPGSVPPQLTFHTFYLHPSICSILLMDQPSRCPCSGDSEGTQRVATSSPGTSPAGDTMRINHGPCFSSVPYLRASAWKTGWRCFPAAHSPRLNKGARVSSPPLVSDKCGAVRNCLGGVRGICSLGWSRCSEWKTSGMRGKVFPSNFWGKHCPNKDFLWALVKVFWSSFFTF